MLLGHGRLAGPVTPSQVWLDPARGAADGLTQEGEIDLGVRGGGRPTGVPHVHILQQQRELDHPFLQDGVVQPGVVDHVGI